MVWTGRWEGAEPLCTCSPGALPLSKSVGSPTQKLPKPCCSELYQSFIIVVIELLVIELNLQPLSPSMRWREGWGWKFQRYYRNPTTVVGSSRRPAHILKLLRDPSSHLISINSKTVGTSLVVQWLRILASTAGGMVRSLVKKKKIQLKNWKGLIMNNKRQSCH